MGDLGFKRCDFLFELLICASESIGFKAVDGIPMLDGGNEPSRNVSGLFGGEVLGKNVDCCLCYGSRSRRVQRSDITPVKVTHCIGLSLMDCMTWYDSFVRMTH